MSGNNVYQIVTDRIIAEMEKGVIPWHKPWICSGKHAGAFNRISKRSYSLLNQILLSHTGEYASFKQWKDLGGKVRKGEKAEIVVFWKMLDVTETDKDGKEVKKKIPLLRYLNVFHISQVDGVEPLESPSLEEGTEEESLLEAENVIAGYIGREGIRLENTEESDNAFYSPATDRIVVPRKSQYKNIHEYYSTLFHEMVHSTGHEKRLNRLETGKAAAFGGQSYSKEELVAEIGSAAILNTLNIEVPETFQNSVAYIQSWLKVLKNDCRFIVSAAGKAEKAVDYILVAGS